MFDSDGDDGCQFDAFANNVKRVVRLWVIWKRAFDDAEAKHDQSFFGETAPEFWDAIRFSLLESSVLGLARLADPLQSCGKNNLTVDRVFGLLDSRKHQALYRQTKSARKRFRDVVDGEDFKNLRRKVLAHNDLSVALRLQEVDIDIEVIETAVGWLRLFCSRCEAHRLGHGGGGLARSLDEMESSMICVVDSLMDAACGGRSLDSFSERSLK